MVCVVRVAQPGQKICYRVCHCHLCVFFLEVVSQRFTSSGTFLNWGGLCLEWETERLKQCAALIVGLCSGNDSDVHTTNVVDLVLVHFVEH